MELFLSTSFLKFLPIPDLSSRRFVPFIQCTSPPAISCSNRCGTFSIRIRPHLFLAVLFEFKIEWQDQVGSLPLWPLIKSSDIYYLSDCHPWARSGLSLFFSSLLMRGATFLLIPPQAAVCIHSMLVINSSALQPFGTLIHFIS